MAWRRYYLLPGVLLLPMTCLLLRGSAPERDLFSGFSLRPRPSGALPSPEATQQPIEALSKTAGPPGPSVPEATPAASPARPTPAGPPPVEMPGVQARDVLWSLEASRFSCSPPTFRGPRITWTCSQDTPQGSCSVTLYSAGTETIRSLEATVTGSFTDLTSATILGSVASLSYADAEPARARAWVASHISDGGTVVIGSVRFEMSGAQGSRSLRMSARGID